MSFLNAEWRKLVLVNYEVDPKILESHVPYGTELDFWQGKCYVSLVGFMFLNTKMLGRRIPFHVNFEEVNLRFYVKREHNGEFRRGVVFIKEIVPKFAITAVANTVYREHYETLRMKHEWLQQDGYLSVSYSWKKKGKWNSVKVKAKTPAKPFPEDSKTEFITEHYWGYAYRNKTSSNEYEVTHPRWEAYEVADFSLDVDFGTVYGTEFGFLNEQEPASVMLAEGSEITVEKKVRIKKA